MAIRLRVVETIDSTCLLPGGQECFEDFPSRDAFAATANNAYSLDPLVFDDSFYEGIIVGHGVVHLVDARIQRSPLGFEPQQSHNLWIIDREGDSSGATTGDLGEHLYYLVNSSIDWMFPQVPYTTTLDRVTSGSSAHFYADTSFLSSHLVRQVLSNTDRVDSVSASDHRAADRVKVAITATIQYWSWQVDFTSHDSIS